MTTCPVVYSIPSSQPWNQMHKRDSAGSVYVFTHTYMYAIIIIKLKETIDVSERDCGRMEGGEN